jgi:glycerol-3-phosphate acyltransferase PlsX
MAGMIIRIAVDAMGGDNFPDVLVEGSFAALQRFPDVEISLVGDESLVGDCIARTLDAKYGRRGARRAEETVRSRLHVVHAPEVIDMSESPGRSVRMKKDSSIVICNKLCRSGGVDAVIAAGNTGAAMAASLLYMGRLVGVSRPAIMALFPSEKNFVAVLDVGANTDCKPGHLYQFGVMASIYTRHILGYEKPRIGLLNNGEERTKGNELTTEAFRLFEQSDLNFVGNIEGRDIFKGAADVVVCDGFVGNVLLKFGESIFGFITHELRQKSSRSFLRKMVAGLMKPVFREIKKEMSSEEYGGAPLLGVDGISIICHGNSSPTAIANAVKVARQFVYEEVNLLIKNELSRKTIVSDD